MDIDLAVKRLSQQAARRLINSYARLVAARFDPQYLQLLVRPLLYTFPSYGISSPSSAPALAGLFVSIAAH